MKTSNKLLLALLIAIMLVIAFIAYHFRVFFQEHFVEYNEDDIVEEFREVDNFDKLDITTNLIVYFTQDSLKEVKVRLNRAYINNVLSEVEDGVLTFSTHIGIGFFKGDSIFIQNPELRAVKISSGASFNTTDQLFTSTFYIDGGSGSNINLIGHFDTMHILLGSGAKSTISGSTSKLYLEAGTGSQVNMEELIAEHVDVVTSTGANVKVYAAKSLSVNASSGSRVEFTGNPELKNIQIATGAMFTQKDKH